MTKLFSLLFAIIAVISLILVMLYIGKFFNAATLQTQVINPRPANFWRIYIKPSKTADRRRTYETTYINTSRSIVWVRSMHAD